MQSNLLSSYENGLFCKYQRKNCLREEILDAKSMKESFSRPLTKASGAGLMNATFSFYHSHRFAAFSAFIALSAFYSRPKIASAATVKEEDFISALATMIEAKIIVKPTQTFVEAQAYDRARTNLQVLQLL